MQPFELIKTVKVDQFKALGPYSAGKVVSGNANLVFLSGQLGTVPDVIIIFNIIEWRFDLTRCWGIGNIGYEKYVSPPQGSQLRFR